MPDRATVGLLYPGEMGASLAGLLVDRGVRVVTSLAGRSDRTSRLARDAGVIALPSLGDVARESRLVLTLVDPAAACQVAQAFCAAAADAAPPGAIYVEANSIGPELAREIGAGIAATGLDYIDGSINGPAKNLATGGTLFLSGPRADEAAEMLGVAVRTRVLGREIGRASAMKMLLGGMTKGVCGLFLELATVAHRRGMLAEMIEACTTIYPGITVLIDRMLPTYTRHAVRRATEMRELERTSRNSGVEPCVIDAIRELHEQLAALRFAEADGASVAALIERTVSGGLLSADTAPAPPETPVKPTAA